MLIAIIICCGSLFSLNAQQRYGHAKVKITYDSIRSNVLGETRKISIYKPEVFPEYAEVVSPVIYLLDGEYYTDYVATMINLMCERFVTMPPIMVVGIENLPNGSIGRQRDMTPLVAKDSSFYKTSGGADKFLKFIQEEVFPFVEKNHKKTPYRILVGHSLAGWLVIHSFLKHPDMFNAYLASSPAMYMDQSAYIKIAQNSINSITERNNRLFFSVGSEAGAYTPNARKIDTLLKNRNITGLSYEYLEYPRDEHATVHIKSFYDGLHFIFNMDPPSRDKTAKEMYNLVEDQYRTFSKIFGCNMSFESVINNYGYEFMKTDIDRALELFKMNVAKYPNSGNVYDSYAEALLKKGDKKNAMINYEKAFQMDPTNTAARDIVNKLKNGQ